MNPIDDKIVFERHEIFMQLIRSHYYIVHRTLNNYRFILQHERNDYTQEMMLAAWKDFGNYFDAQRQGVEFGAWFTIRCKFAAIKYRRSLKTTFSVENRFISRIVFFENMEQFDLTDNGDDMNPHIDGIIKAVNELTIEEQKIIQMYLTDSLQKLSLNHGKDRHYYSGRFEKIKAKIIKKRTRYFKNILVQKSRSVNRIMSGENNKQNKAVCQIDIITGNVLKKYPAMNAAKEEGFDPKKISEVCLGKRKSHGEYYWQYSEN